MQSLTRTLNIIILCNIGIITLQRQYKISLIYLQKDELWYQFNPLFHGSPLLSNSSLMKASYHVWMMSKSQKSRKYFIHGPHVGHGERFCFCVTGVAVWQLTVSINDFLRYNPYSLQYYSFGKAKSHIHNNDFCGFNSWQVEQELKWTLKLCPTFQVHFKHIPCFYSMAVPDSFFTVHWPFFQFAGR